MEMERSGSWVQLYSVTIMNYFSACLLLLPLLGKVSSACQVKRFDDSNSFVCVCNQSYCDRLDSVLSLSPATWTIFKSDQEFSRFSKSVYPDAILKETSIGVDENRFEVRVNLSKRFQEIIGFGGSFTDAAGININRLSPMLQDSLLVDYFGSEGAEYNLARVPIGGSDFSDRPYSYDDVPGDFELEHFALAYDDLHYKIPHIKRAQGLSNDLKLFGSPWAPPAWMKTNNDSKGLGILIGEPGTPYWKTWANYFVKFFDSYKENGVEFWGFTPINEPVAGLEPGWRWNCLGFSPSMMRDFIKKDLGPTVQAAGYGLDKVKLLIYDHNNDEIWSYTRRILSDKEAAKYVAGIAYHWYARSGFHDELIKVHEAFPDYFLISTEACEGYASGRSDKGVTLGNWTRAETYAMDIMAGLNRWSTGWVDWNLVLDPQGGPNWASNYVDAPVIVSDDGSEYYKQPMYYSMAHFSKFLKPGSTRVDHEIVSGASDDIHMVTFVNPSNELVVVVLNTKETRTKMTIDGLDKHKFTIEIGPKSLQTIMRPLTD